MLRVCDNGHLTGQRVCPMCGSKKSKPLADRQEPQYLPRRHPAVRALRELRAATRVSSGPAPIFPAADVPGASLLV